MNVVAHDPFLTEADVEMKFHPQMKAESFKVTIPMITKDELLAQSDFVTLHMPGGGKTVIGEHEISLMKKGAVLVNCARGGVVDEKAMSEALSQGHLAAVGLDVFETEPPVNMDFFTRDDVSLSPHIGAATSEAQERIGEELANKIIEHFN
jgi:D-3-phosphoglycerate dehydrogenase